MTTKREFTPSAVGRAPSSSQIRNDLDDLDAIVATSELDRHIVRLLALHPQVTVRFRNQDLSTLDDTTKQVLLSDLNRVLGIRPLRKRKS